MSATPRTVQVTPEALQNPAYLSLGDRFPDYELFDPAQEITTTVAALTSRQPALLIFASESCGICQAMARYWRKMVVSEIRSDIQLVLVFDQTDWTGTLDSTSNLYLPGAQIYLTDRKAQIEDDGIVGTPILVGLATESEIRFISPGFNWQVGSEFINKYL